MKFGVLFPYLDERQRRLVMAAEARILGHGGIQAVARAAQISETTVRKGVNELVAGEEPLGRIRRPGGGRKKAVDLDPGVRLHHGIYGIAANTGWVSVGTDHDTAALAVASIRRWWQARGRHDYPAATRLLITADAGGSPSPRRVVGISLESARPTARSMRQCVVGACSNAPPGSA